MPDLWKIDVKAVPIKKQHFQHLGKDFHLRKIPLQARNEDFAWGGGGCV